MFRLMEDFVILWNVSLYATHIEIILVISYIVIKTVWITLIFKIDNPNRVWSQSILITAPLIFDFSIYGMIIHLIPF